MDGNADRGITPTAQPRPGQAQPPPGINVAHPLTTISQPGRPGLRWWRLQLIKQLFGVFALFAAFITLNPVVEALLRFIL